MRAIDPTLERLVAALRAEGLEGARVALVLGSGLSGLAARLEGARPISPAALENLPAGAVPGHAGTLRAGRLCGVAAIVQAGRPHLYEGHGARAVARSVRAFAALGVRALVLTNAAGGLRPEWAPGTLMRLTDHVNLQGATPLESAEAGYGSPYDVELGAECDAAARAAGIALEQGVYAGLSGPSYETPAEIGMLRAAGVDAVGMSTVLEAQAGRAAGLRVVAVALVANPAAGLARAPLSHEEVLASAEAASERLGALLEAAVPRLDALSR